MPGILPMKVIKVGPSAQSRIAQACDRCRSKKIRCDGITPCCSQCATVGFECKTSDKLSRRAFPRGYTESLEERVRALETEVKELKDLLDEKDEKIDILSKIHSSSPQRRPSVPLTPAVSCAESAPVSPQIKEETFKVQQSPALLNSGRSDPCFMGASTGKTFIDAFKAKLQQTGKPCPPFSTSSYFMMNADQRLNSRNSNETLYSGALPRLVSDQLVNTFFQEWAPLFPVLHRPTFLKLYAEYTTDPDKVKNQAEVAQLNLVFAIAFLSSDCNKDLLPSLDSQWQGALESILSENTLATLQCLILAQIYCICSADSKTLIRYTGAAVALAHRLGLHQSQKRFSLGALTRETRKKVFWTLYTVDCLSAATLGLPKLLKDVDVHTEYPSDIDDENVTERGFQPALPGESTRLSSAIALFRLARVMSKVLGELYPAAPSYELSLSKIAALNEELDVWHQSLASHLRLQFIQDKPSTNVISSRSPLISLAYYYTRTLIHRPVVASELGHKALSSQVALSESSKRIIQIIQLLEERRMALSIALNKNELLLLAGFALLHQGLDLKDDSKLLADNQRLACSIINILSRQEYPGATSFKEIACSVTAVDAFAKPVSPAEQKSTVRRDSTASMSAPQSASTSLSVRKQLQAISSRFSFNTNRPSQRNVKYDKCLNTQSSLAVGNLALYARNTSRSSLSSVRSEPPISKCNYPCSQPVASTPTIVTNGSIGPNLDYLAFNHGDGYLSSPEFLPSPNNALTHPSEWDRLLCYIEANQPMPLGYEHGIPSQTYPPTYPPSMATASPEMLSGNASYVGTASPTLDWASEVCWSGTGESVGQGSSSSGNAHSVFSLSEESLTSGEEGGGCDLGPDLGQEYLGVDWATLGGLEEGAGNGLG